MRTLLTKSLALAVLLTALAASPSPAAAGYEPHLSSGTSCVTAYGEDQTVYWDDGGLYSAASTWWRTAVCPLVGNGTSNYTARVYDRHYSLDVNCRAITALTNGVVWSAATTTTGSSPQEMVVSISAAYSTYANLLCYLPQTYQGQRSGILGYRYDSWF